MFKNGKSNQNHDIIMLEHEYFEILIENDYKILREAHEVTSGIYDYQKAIDDFKKKWGGY